jgi:hypothetical protein
VPKEKGYTTGLKDETLELPMTKWYYLNTDMQMGEMRQQLNKLRKKIVIVELDNWIGLYIDGKCVFQGHSMEPYFLLELLKIENERHWIENYDPDAGSLPDDLSELESYF